MVENYFSVLVFIGIGFVIGVALPILSWLVSPKAPNKAKLSSYECGFEPQGDTRVPFDVRFYLVAILFILFDLETAFLVPWAVVFREVGMGSVITIAVFLTLLLVGFVYEWKKGGLEWE